MTTSKPLPMTRDEMLARARARDRSCDGKFLTGVLSTGIYCLPSCPARPPKAENVVHFAGPEAARAQGLRPCRRCRPDDFYRGYDPDREQIETTARAVRTAPGDFSDVEAIARHAGVGATKLSELFREHFHTTPLAYLNRARIEQACVDLRATRRRVLNVGLDAGFESTSAFHDNFRRYTGMSPGDYRKSLRGRSFDIALPPGYRTQDVLRYLGRDAESACERVAGRTIHKAGGAGPQRFLLTMDVAKDRIRCAVDVPGKRELSPEIVAAAHAMAVRLLNLRADPSPFERFVTRKLGEGRLIKGRKGARMSMAGDLFETIVWAIVGQQVNLAFAYTLRRRLVGICGERVGDLRTHPSPQRVAKLDYDDLKPHQFSRRKAEYLIDTARLLASGALDLGTLGRGSVHGLREKLLAIRGFGPWTVDYLLMRGFGLADCVPVGDAGLVAALAKYHQLDERPDAEQTRSLMAPYAPWRTFACFHMWQSLAG